jgi:hypothetical protein
MTERENWSKAGKVCSACAELQYQECDHVRGGKTRREHADGTWSTRFTNRQQRVSWQKGGGDNKTFPTGSCNGKKNRIR